MTTIPAHAALNGFVVRVALPALILGQIHGLRLTTNLLWPAGPAARPPGAARPELFLNRWQDRPPCRHAPGGP